MAQAGDPGAGFELLLTAQRQLVFEQQTEPFGMTEAARFMFVFEFLEPFGQAVESQSKIAPDKTLRIPIQLC